MKSLHNLVRSIAAAAVSLPAIAGAAAFEPTRVAKDATWVLHVDAERAFSSKLWQIIDENMDPTQHLRMVAGLELLHDFTGVDLFNDLQDVTIYGHSFKPGDAVLILHGKWNPANLIAVLQNAQNYDAADHNKHTVHRWTDNNDGKTRYGSFVGDDVIVIGEVEKTVDDALDVFDDQAGRAMSPEDGPQRPPPDAGLIAFVTADGVDALRASGEARSPVLDRIRAGWLSVGESDTRLVLRANIQPNLPTTARQLVNAANGLKAFAQIVIGQDAPKPAQDGVAMLDAASAKVDADGVVIELPIDFDALSGFAKDVAAEHAGRSASSATQPAAPTTQP